MMTRRPFLSLLLLLVGGFAFPSCSCISAEEGLRIDMVYEAGGEYYLASPAGAVRIGDFLYPIESYGWDETDFGDGVDAYQLAYCAEEGGEQLVFCVPEKTYSRKAYYLLRGDRVIRIPPVLGKGQSHGAYVAEFLDSVTHETIYIACDFDAGTTFFELRDDVAVLRGECGEELQQQLRMLLRDHPHIRTIEFASVGGLGSKPLHFSACGMIRQKGMHTHLPQTGVVWGSSVDLYLAGSRRTAHPDAKIGINSWGGLYSTNRQLLERKKFYALAMPRGEDFFEATLKLADPFTTHYMDAAELQPWGFTTHSH
jgi:hypothetical protein